MCLVVDECHKAVGDASVVKAVQQLRREGIRFRMLGLSATPGSSLEAIQVCRVLVLQFLILPNGAALTLDARLPYQTGGLRAVCKKCDRSLWCLFDLPMPQPGALTKIRAHY